MFYYNTMNPKVWGSSAWLFLHTITLDYPDEPTKEDKEKYREFFISLSYVIPCETCKEHYLETIRKFPINLESKETLTKWLHNIHNQVNLRNNKEIYSYEDFIEHYSRLYDNSTSNDTQRIIYIIIFIFLLFLILRE